MDEDKAMSKKGRVYERNMAKRFQSPNWTFRTREGVGREGQKSKYDFGTIAGNIHIDRPLTDMSLKYRNGTMIADSICPRVPVKNITDEYFIYGRDDFEIVKDERADTAEANFVNPLSVTTDNYRCKEHNQADRIGDNERENADPPLSPDIDRQENLTNRLMLNREKRVADLLTPLASWATIDPLTSTEGGIDILASGGATKQWDYVSGATVFNSDDPAWNIEAIIDHAKQAILNNIGKDPNVVIIPRPISRVMKKDTRVRTQIQYTHADILTDGELPDQLWNLQVFEPSAIYNTAERGQSFVGSNIWGNNIIVMYLAESPRQIKTMSACMTMQYKPRFIKKWREEWRQSDAIQVAEYVTEKITSTYCGFVIKNPIIHF